MGICYENITDFFKKYVVIPCVAAKIEASGFVEKISRKHAYFAKARIFIQLPCYGIMRIAEI